jgi:hypothetical protein
LQRPRRSARRPARLTLSSMRLTPALLTAGAFALGTAAVLPAGGISTSAPPALSNNNAVRYVHLTLLRRLGRDYFDPAYPKLRSPREAVGSCARLGSSRFRCKVDWWMGMGLHLSGNVTVWLPNRTVWDYAYVIQRTEYACVATPCYLHTRVIRRTLRHQGTYRK